MTEAERSDDLTETLTAEHDETVLQAGTVGGAAALPVRDPGRYERIAEIAHGGMGRIVAARDLELGREVAIKELLAVSPVLEARFVREVALTMRLQHPAIIAVLDAGRWPDGGPFYAMPRVAGRALRDVIADAASLDQRIALVPHVLAVADALGHAHSRSVIHRDLKPANVLVGAFGETIVIDWGLGKHLRDAAADEPGSSGPAEAGMTVPGRALGTPAYMAPEQARGEPVDARADVYAIGAMLYHVLARHPPHGDGRGARDGEGGSPHPPRLDDIVPDAPPDLLAIVGKAMALEPAARYPTAAELAADLRRFATGQLVAAHRYSLRQLLRRWIARHRAAVVVAAAAAVVLAGGGVVAVERIREQRDAASAQREVAEQHRGQVEGLLDFLLVDLHKRLEPIGKLELLALVADRADAYYRDRPVDGTGEAANRRALARLHLGEVRVASGDLPGGLAAYRDALALFVRTGDAASIATCDEKIGTALSNQGDLAGALAALGDSLAIRRRRADELPGDGERQRALAATHRKIGDLYLAQSDLSRALTAYRDSLAIGQQLTAREPGDAEAQRVVAIAHSKVGDVLDSRVDLPGALAAYRSAQAIFEALAAHDPTNTTLQYNLSAGYDNVATVLMEQKDPTGALAVYRASLAIVRRLADQDPANTEWQRGLALGEANLGNALRDQGDRVGALAAYQRAHAIRVRLAAQDPTNIHWQHDVSISLERIGGIQHALGDLAAALAAYQESLAIRERLAARDPRDTSEQRDLFIAHYKVGTIAEARGDAASARRSYQIGSEGLDRLSAAHPDDASLRADADELRAWLARCCARPRP